jgi:hypothetical protein
MDGQGNLDDRQLSRYILFVRFNVGDTVKLKPSSLLNERLTPSKFVIDGFPNRFTVTRIETALVSDANGNETVVNAIALAQCCRRICINKIPLCDSHPEDLFEEYNEIFDMSKPERETVIETPLGRLLKLGYYKKEGNGAIRLEPPLGLAPFSITGPWADFVANKLKELGVL